MVSSNRGEAPVSPPPEEGKKFIFVDCQAAFVSCSFGR